MKKIYIILSVIAVILIITNSIFAAGSIYDYWEFMIKNNPASIDINEQNSSMSRAEIDNMLDESMKEFNSDENNFTDDKRKNALNILTSLENANIVSKNTEDFRNTDYDTNQAKLRKANFIEGILDIDEKMTLVEIFKVGVTYADSARDLALKEFPKNDYTNVMLRDAFRHFSWNNISSKDLGAYKTRTATINHEWGIEMLDPMIRYFDHQYNSYKGKYNDAGNKALADTINYIPTAKHYLVTLCKGSYKFFKSFFDVSNIMDLHNNCWGRAYASKYKNLSCRDAYYKAKSNKELILAENLVTNANFDYIWRSQWYTY